MGSSPNRRGTPMEMEPQPPPLGLVKLPILDHRRPGLSEIESMSKECHIGPTEKVTMGMAMDSTLHWMYSRPKRVVKSAAKGLTSPSISKNHQMGHR